MPLSGVQLDQIHRAIHAAYSREELRRVVKVCMDVDFDAIAPEKGFSDQLWTFIAWANRQGRALELVRCAWEHNKGNIELNALAQQAPRWEPPYEPPAPQIMPDSHHTVH